MTQMSDIFPEMTVEQDPFNRQPGETRTIAVFRAVVFAKRGGTVKVPAELIQQ